METCDFLLSNGGRVKFCIMDVNVYFLYLNRQLKLASWSAGLLGKAISSFISVTNARDNSCKNSIQAGRSSFKPFVTYRRRMKIYLLRLLTEPWKKLRPTNISALDAMKKHTEHLISFYLPNIMPHAKRTQVCQKRVDILVENYWWLVNQAESK